MLNLKVSIEYLSLNVPQPNNFLTQKSLISHKFYSFCHKKYVLELLVTEAPKQTFNLKMWNAKRLYSILDFSR